MSTTHITIVLTIATGLAVIAFKTPDIYSKLEIPLTGLLFVSLLLLMSWSMCRPIVYFAIIEFVPLDKYAMATKAYETTSIKFGYYLTLISASFYTPFLSWLSSQVLKNRKNKKPEKEMRH